jgi:hypothetical protein
MAAGVDAGLLGHLPLRVLIHILQMLNQLLKLNQKVK